ncbi:hypothetical protein BSKO_12872 [Bryopsis sp. KO-2023]|nr:hypothetical protein BSKO_12872 [Bryopsis sp. KO-2023]
MLRRAAVQLGRVASKEVSQAMNMCAAAAEAPAPKVPAIVHGVAGKYASALWVAAAKANNLPQVETDFAKVLETANDSKDFLAFMMDPCQSRVSKAEGIRSILTDLQIGEITTNFFSVMAENGRMKEAFKTYDTFVTLMEAHKGQVRANIISAEELDASETKEVEESLLKLLEPGQSLILKTKVDPSVIGGLVIELGDKHIDLSVSRRLRDIEKLLSEAV